MKTISIIGVGLIGGSLATDLKRHNNVKIYGIDASPAHLHTARHNGMIDIALPQLTVEAANADMVIIATPVMTMNAVIQDLAQKLHADSHTVITDVGSTKQSVIAAFQCYLPQQMPYCVAGHPLAGSEKSGASAAERGLFEHKKVVLCPHEQQHSGSLKKVQDLWHSIGAEVYLMSAQEHDRIFAATSHLPHLLAYAFMQQIATDPQSAQLLHFAASGFRDFTRIAGSNPDMWIEICLANQTEITTRLADYQQQLQQIADLLHRQDKAALRALFANAQQMRSQWQNPNPKIE